MRFINAWDAGYLSTRLLDVLLRVSPLGNVRALFFQILTGGVRLVFSLGRGLIHPPGPDSGLAIFWRASLTRI
jgi:hypothetical protein